MKAKEWRRRINKAADAWANGDQQLMTELCDELESLTEPPPLPPRVELPNGLKELGPVDLTAVTPPTDGIQT